MKAVVCLPTRNEKDSIQPMIDSIKKLRLPLFISDENSTDGTQEIARKNHVRVFQRDGKGKGYGMRKAVEVARQLGYDVLVTIDCDCTYPAGKITDLLKAIEGGADMVIAVRNMKNIRPLHRLPNKIHTLAINILFFRFFGRRNWLHDINSGMRAFRLGRIRPFRSKGFDIEAEITVRAIKDGLKIAEIPVEYEKRVGESKIRIKDGFTILMRIIKERFLP
ncbi:glycosyltransferase [Candidatus Woesearchaeota archaeon]|nr:glycosyltransferase [Candidatus Woesearchaeota archaeon]